MAKRRVAVFRSPLIVSWAVEGDPSFSEPKPGHRGPASIIEVDVPDHWPRVGSGCRCETFPSYHVLLLPEGIALPCHYGFRPSRSATEALKGIARRLPAGMYAELSVDRLLVMHYHEGEKLLEIQAEELVAGAQHKARSALMRPRQREILERQRERALLNAMSPPEVAGKTRHEVTEHYAERARRIVKLLDGFREGDN